MADEPTALVQRDEKGRILPGVKLALGHKGPHQGHIQLLKSAMMEAVSPQVMKDLTLRAIELCYHDNPKHALAALDLVMSRVFGKPKESVEVSTTNNTTVTNLSGVQLDSQDFEALVKLRNKLQPEPAQPEIVIEADVPQTAQDHATDTIYRSDDPDIEFV